MAESQQITQYEKQGILKCIEGGKKYFFTLAGIGGQAQASYFRNEIEKTMSAYFASHALMEDIKKIGYHSVMDSISDIELVMVDDMADGGSGQFENAIEKATTRQMIHIQDGAPLHGEDIIMPRYAKMWNFEHNGKKYSGPLFNVYAKFASLGSHGPLNETSYDAKVHLYVVSDNSGRPSEIQ